MLEVGDIIYLTDGKTLFISNRDSERSVTLETANKLYAEGKIRYKLIEEDGEEFFADIQSL